MIAEIPSPTTRIDLLRLIHSKMQNFKRLVGNRKHPISHPLSCTTANIPVLRLPFPEDILLTINALPLPEGLSQSLRQSITAKVHDSQVLYTQSFEQTCREIMNPSLPIQALKKLQESYQTTYQEQHISRIREEILKYSTTLGTRGVKKRPIFNTVC